MRMAVVVLVLTHEGEALRSLHRRTRNGSRLDYRLTSYVADVIWAA